MKPEEILTLLRQVASMLEPGAQEVWKIAYRQALITGWALTIPSAILAIISVAAMALCLSKDAKGTYTSSDDNAGAVWLICFIGSMPWLVWGLTILANPAWKTLSLLRGLIGIGQ